MIINIFVFVGLPILAVILWPAYGYDILAGTVFVYGLALSGALAYAVEKTETPDI